MSEQAAEEMGEEKKTLDDWQLTIKRGMHLIQASEKTDKSKIMDMLWSEFRKLVRQQPILSSDA